MSILKRYIDIKRKMLMLNICSVNVSFQDAVRHKTQNVNAKHLQCQTLVLRGYSIPVDSIRGDRLIHPPDSLMGGTMSRDTGIRDHKSQNLDLKSHEEEALLSVPLT